MNDFKEATWTNKKRKVKGWWKYNWSSDTFTVLLDKIDSITGEQKSLIVYGADSPEWGNWKLERG